MIHLDTSFLVDLLRETGRRESGPASAFLDDLADEQVRISAHVACELCAGAELSKVRTDRARVAELCAAIEVVYPDEDFAGSYGRLLARLQRAGETIATMDLLIATAAVVDGAALVTRNTRHFARVPELELLEY